MTLPKPRACAYIQVVNQQGPFRIPSTSALTAFESAARHGNFSRAAEELRTSQPTISRQITLLEKHLSVRLFERSRTGVTLTEAGKRFREAVSSGLGLIHAAVQETAQRTKARQLVIACSHEASYFFIMPRYNGLRKILGEEVQLRVLTYRHSQYDLPPGQPSDVLLTWDEASAPPECRWISLREAVRPVCSPDYAMTHSGVLQGPVSGWGGLTFLDLEQPSQGWSTWDNWFQAAGLPETGPRFDRFDHYSYVIEAAAAGCGIALGWRYFVERYLENRTLVELADGYVEFDNYYYGVLTPKGKGNPLAHQCLEYLAESV